MELPFALLADPLARPDPRRQRAGRCAQFCPTARRPTSTSRAPATRLSTPAVLARGCGASGARTVMTCWQAKLVLGTHLW